MYKPSMSIWLNPNIEYLFNDEIIEYDMRDAGFSLIKQYKLLPIHEIKKLDQLEKFNRVIAIGKLQRDKILSSELLSNAFAEMRAIFLEANILTDNDIISVKKDAIFSIKKCNNLKFKEIEFVEKNVYSSYIRFTNNSNIEIFYNDGELDIKGIGESGVNRHRLYSIAFISKIIKSIESKNPLIKRQLKSFIDDYKAGNLDEGYYVEFNNRSNAVNPMYNYQNLIIPLVQLVLEEIDK